MAGGRNSSRRARRSFWMLTGIALAAMGALSTALAAAPGPPTGLLVIGAGTVLLLALGLAGRVLLVLERARLGGPLPGSEP